MQTQLFRGQNNHLIAIDIAMAWLSDCLAMWAASRFKVQGVYVCVCVCARVCCASYKVFDEFQIITVNS